MSLPQAAPEYGTTALRAVAALIAGTITGGVLVAGFAIASGTLRPESVIADFTVIFIAAAVVWAGGLFLAAPLPWIVLHRLGWRRWPVAVALGAVLSFLAVLGLMTNAFGLIPWDGISVADNDGPMWTDGRITAHGWADALDVAALCGAAGTVVGFVVWRVAYRRAASTS
ncbi:MAG: hypothetical protein AB7K67_10720 [Hyphomicrobiaceae bacterium]